MPSMPRTIDLNPLWAELQARPPAEGNLLALELSCEGLAPRAVLLSHDDDRRRGVLLRVRDSSTELPALKAAGLEIRHESRVGTTGDLDHFIQISCISDELHPVFDKLIERVIQRLVQGSTAADACRDAVREFRRLLARSRGDLPAEEVIIGLIGELHFLLQLVDPCGGSSSLQLFYFLNGALTDVHDFFVDRIAHNDRRRATNVFLDFDTSWESLDHITRLFERLGPVFGSLALVMPVRMHFIVQPGQEAEELQVLYTLRIIRALYAREDHWRAIPASSRSVLHG